MKKKIIKASIALLSIAALAVNILQAQTKWKMQPVVMQTRWAKDVNPNHTLEDYPRPQMNRANWTNLNGLWQYVITKKDSAMPLNFNGNILVPYPIESALSGVKKAILPDENLWYKKTINFKPSVKGLKTLLHFGAVDWQATIYINGKEVGSHTGGYTSFSLDITDQVKFGKNEIVVKVFDPTDQGIGPHGKQVLNPANIYYTPTSGIWQTVWLETVPKSYIQNLKITPDIDLSVVRIKVNGNSVEPININFNNKIFTGKTGQDIIVPVKNPILWSPENPFLYTFSVKQGADEVKSYFGMRKISIQKDAKGFDRITLNNKPYYNLGTLDQGFWPEGLYTAPTDEALAYDIKAIKAMGFNTIRKHIKVEPAKWYYYADKLGVLVWQDLVDPNQGLPPGSKSQFENESDEILKQLHNYPSITTWVVFNEEWGAYDQARITKWVKDTDPTRIINGHSGGVLYIDGKKSKGADTVYVNSDMTDIHSYPQPMQSKKETGKAQICGEFGGVGVSVPGHEWNDLQGWGYVQATPKDLIAKYTTMTNRLMQLKDEGLSGSIYTQPFDVEGEENGLMTYDREIIKMPIQTIRDINSQLIPLTPLPQTFRIGKTIDQEDTDGRYPELLKLFETGKRDSAFLRRLTLIAIRRKDQDNATIAGNAYIMQLKQPFFHENLFFIRQITRTSKDKGFEMCLNDSSLVNAKLGRYVAQDLVQNIISKEEIAPYFKNDSTSPNWERIIGIVDKKYGLIGKERVYGEAMLYFMPKKDTTNLSKYFVLYYNTALTHSRYIINQVAWEIFQQINDSAILNRAIQIMEYDLATEYAVNTPAEVIDTYANLLYKIGRKSDAIKEEHKAVKYAPDNKEISEAFEKMKRGEKTW
jgi:tetratricopeptide (TPR) repeat protein